MYHINIQCLLNGQISTMIYFTKRCCFCVYGLYPGRSHLLLLRFSELAARTRCSRGRASWLGIDGDRATEGTSVVYVIGRRPDSMEGDGGVGRRPRPTAFHRAALRVHPSSRPRWPDVPVLGDDGGSWGKQRQMVLHGVFFEKTECTVLLSSGTNRVGIFFASFPVSNLSPCS